MLLHRSSQTLRGYLGDTVHTFIVVSRGPLSLQAPNIMQTDLDSAWMEPWLQTEYHLHALEQAQLGGFDALFACICYIQQWFKTKAQTCNSLLKRNIFHLCDNTLIYHASCKADFVPFLWKESDYKFWETFWLLPECHILHVNVASMIETVLAYPAFSHTFVREKPTMPTYACTTQPTCN